MRCVLLLLFFFTPGAMAQQNNPPLLPTQLQGLGIEQRLNASIPLDTVFRDEHGESVSLKKYFGKLPVLLVPVYFTCPMLCNQILSGVVAGLRPLSLQPGRDFEVVAFSFNPEETPEEARKKWDLFTQRYSPREKGEGWHFLTGSEESVRALTNAIGFHYRYDPATKMFIHASGIMALTPDGKIARYFYGVEYEPKDLKLGLVEASDRKITSPVDRILLFCYHYDPATGKYGAAVMNLLRLTAVLMLVFMAVGLTMLWRLDLRHYRS